MKKLTLVALTAFAAICSFTAEAKDGQFHFRGQITTAPCGVIVPNGGYVQMNEWATSELKQDTATTLQGRSVPFSIQLVDCDTSVTTKTVTTTFTGPLAGINGAFAVSSLGNDSQFGGDNRQAGQPATATGVGLKLFNADNTALNAGAASTAVTFTPQTTLSFQAAYVYTGASASAATAGYADSDVDFTLNYL